MGTNFELPLQFLFPFFIISSLIIPILAEVDNYIIHMDPSAMPTAFSGHESWYLATLNSVSENGIATKPPSSKLLYTYTHVMNGFSATLTPSEIEALKKSPGFIYSIKDMPVKHDTTRSTTFLGLSADSGAWKVSNFGAGVVVGLVDSGIWPESESYDDNGMPEIPKGWKGECESGTLFNSSLCNRKLIGARYFNKGLIARNVTISVNSARDTDGHGTHTSSTAAGNFVDGASFFGYAPGTAKGVAPRAHVAMYKALWDEGGVTSDLIAAIEQAIIDGVDVLSISLGFDGIPLYDDPIAVASFAAVEKNIFVSTSAGNQGPFYESLHNGTPWLLTVAAGTIDRRFVAYLKLGNGVSVSGSSLYPGNSSSPQLPLVFMDNCLDVKELRKVREKIVVCQDKNDSLSDQLSNVYNVSVAGAVFITNTTDLEFYIQVPFPAVFTSPKDGEAIIDYIKSSATPEASMEFIKTIVGIKAAPVVTDYSSRGPSGSCPFVLKPDVLAPGSLVLAAWPDKITVGILNSQPLYSKFNLLSGTSMACPHAAGVAALVKKAHPDWSPAAIRSAMMTTADSNDHASEPIKDMGLDYTPATPFAMGAGQVNPNKAIDPGLIYDLNSTDYVNLLCSLNYTQKQIKIITKSSSNDCSSPNLDLNYPSFIAFFIANASKSGLTSRQEFQRTVTNVGEGTSTYTATVTPMKGLTVSVKPDKLEFYGKYEKQSYVMAIEGVLKENVTYGYLSWVDSGGEHVVKSPIVVTSIEPDIFQSSK